MLSFNKSSKKLFFDDEISWKSQTFGPLLANNSNKWKNELPSNEILLCEKVHEDYIIKNYLLHGKKNLNLLDEIICFVLKTFINISTILLFIRNKL